MKEMSHRALRMIGCERCTGNPIGETSVADIEGATAELMRFNALQYADKMKFWNKVSYKIRGYLDEWDFLERWLFPRRFVTPEEFQAVFRESIPQGVTYSPEEVRRLNAKYPVYSLASIRNEPQRRQFTMTFQDSDEGYFAFMKKKSPALFDFFFS
jgi:hypothetical protein